jgi:Fic family protein
VTAEQASSTAGRVLALFRHDQTKIETIGRAAGSVLRVHQLMRRKPLVTIPRAAADLGLSPPTVAASLQHLDQLGIVSEVTGRRRDRVFVYRQYLDILNEGTAAPSSDPIIQDDKV